MAKEKTKLEKQMQNSKVTKAEAVATLEREVIDRVKKMALGKASGVYPLIQAGKQLLELEGIKPPVTARDVEAKKERKPGRQMREIDPSEF